MDGGSFPAAAGARLGHGDGQETAGPRRDAAEGRGLQGVGTAESEERRSAEALGPPASAIRGRAQLAQATGRAEDA